MIGTRTIATATIAVWASAVGLAQPRAPSQPLTGSVLYRMTLLRAAPGRFDDLLAEVRREAADLAGWRCVTRRATSGTSCCSCRCRPPPRSVAARSHRPFPKRPWRGRKTSSCAGPPSTCCRTSSRRGCITSRCSTPCPASWTNWCASARWRTPYLAAVGRPRNLIFRREFGAAWDAFTIGAYRDWRHYAERDLVTPDQARAAAVAAGFASDQAIGLHAVADPLPPRHLGQPGAVTGPSGAVPQRSTGSA